MTDPPAVSLDREREHAQQLVGEAYAREILDHDEVDRRMEAIQTADSIQAVQRITEDLRLSVALPVPPVAAEPQAVERAPLRVSALFSSLERVGPWTLGSRQDVRVVFGSVTLDLRSVAWASAVAEIHVDIILGSLEIIVPPGLAVDVDCTPIFSSVESQDTVHAGAEPLVSGRRVRVQGRVILGSVSVREQFIGEGVVAAWWRRHRERRALGRRRMRSLPPGKSDDA